MAITIELPEDRAGRLRATTPDPETDMKRALAIELHREQRLSQGQLARPLGITRIEADSVLKDAKVYYEITAGEVIAESGALRELRERHADRR